MAFRVDEGPIASLRDAPGIAASQIATSPIATSHDDENDIAMAGTQTFGRLRALIARGYRPDFSRSDDDCLLLTHPRKQFKYRQMLLDRCGTVQWLHDRDYKMHFSGWEKKRFERFLHDVPTPGWWDHTRVYRENVCVFVIGAIVCAILYTIVSTMLPLIGVLG